MTEPTIAINEPTDPTMVRPVCPRCFAESRTDCCLPGILWTSADMDADEGRKLWEKVDREWSRRYASDVRAWDRERAAAAVEIERLHERIRRDGSLYAAVQEQFGLLSERFDAARAEIERLRVLVGEAIDAGAQNDGDEIARIRREAGI